MTIKIEPLDAPMGAVIHGLDSRKPLSDDDFRAVEQAMLEHIAIVIPDLEENVPWLRD
ncbi:MAG TPA: taurine dioxygenase, partial [Rhodospirillaceae bacterium]|nr:taurine dioxygenase [Rhodospirillaceae bacterium]